jgi:anti-sigma B factor antagonist
MGVDFTDKKADEYLIISIDGVLDVHAGSKLKDYLQEKIDAGLLKVALDMRKVSYVDSTGLGILVSCLSSIRKAGGELVVFDLDSEVAKLFALTRINQFIAVAEDETAAVQILSA